MKYKNIELTKYTQSGFRIDWEGDSSFALSEMSNGKYEQVVYIDPFKLPDNQPNADVIFITHEHGDHLDLQSIQKISTATTILVCNALVAEQLKEITRKELEIIKPGNQKGVNGLIYLALPAYNLDKFRSPGLVYHPQENEGVGYLVNFNIHDDENRVMLYHMGDTDFLDEQQTPEQVDILLIPVSGTYVMTAQEAIAANNIIKPKLSVPMHYDSMVGSIKDAEAFKAGCANEVVIMQAVEE